MRFSVLHISDLHRDLRDEIANGPLLDSLLRDVDHYQQQNPPIQRPAICVVSGDLVYGVKPDLADPRPELERQYDQAVTFLIDLTDRLFGGDRSRVVLLPGNHDISYPAVVASSTRVEIPAERAERKLLTDELFAPVSPLRWSWTDMCFYRITDHEQYEQRLSGFAEAYQRFYSGTRSFRLTPEHQFDLFDYPELGFSVAALNSCYRNDPLHRAGSFHPTALSTACRELGTSHRTGWLLAATWHHSIGGGPLQDDYLDSGFLQVLIDSGISLGFHGHQHAHDCVDERYRLGPSPRKITIISASTLCAEPRNLKPGVPRGYNVVELDTDAWTGRTHSRHMVNNDFDLPVWGPGLFYATGNSHVDFELCKPLSARPNRLDKTLALERADRLLGERKWAEALQILRELKDMPLARPLILTGLAELADDGETVAMLWPPSTSAEIVLVGSAVFNRRIPEEAAAFLQIEAVSRSTDASVTNIKRRIAMRLPR